MLLSGCGLVVVGWWLWVVACGLLVVGWEGKNLWIVNVFFASGHDSKLRFRP